MRAVVIHGSRDLRIETVEVPLLGRNDVLVRVGAGGICGSDLHYYQHGGFGAVRLREPMILGHEVAGTVTKIGSGVAHVKPGMRVAINPSRACRSCRACLGGHSNHCSDIRFYGSAMRFPHVQGAFREEIVVDESQAVPISDTVTLAVAATAEPLSVGLHAIHQAGEVLGQRILVTGCGPIGALLIGGLRRAGAAEIVAVDVSSAPLECALKMGADRALNALTDSGIIAEFAANGGTFDLLFEASGNQQALGVLDILRPRATIILIGLGGDVTLPMNTIVIRELILRGSFRFHEEFGQAVSFLEKGLIDVGPVLSASFPFDRATEAFELAGDRTRAMKVQLTFE